MTGILANFSSSCLLICKALELICYSSYRKWYKMIFLYLKINLKKSLTEGADMSAKLSVSFPTWMNKLLRYLVILLLNLSRRFSHNFTWSCTAANFNNLSSTPDKSRAFSRLLAALTASLSFWGLLEYNKV